MIFRLFKTLFLYTTLLLLISSLYTPSIKTQSKIIENKAINENYNLYNCSEIPNNNLNKKYTIESSIISKIISNYDKKKLTRYENIGIMNSSWPMYCHDIQHTGRSPYSTVDTWDEIWTTETNGPIEGGPVISDDGTIYAGAYRLYAFYSNGSEKWNIDLVGWIVSCPAIDENGTIYVGTTGGGDNYMYAIKPDGTIKWQYPVSNVKSSPVISNDDLIIFGDTDNWMIRALYPNGTLKWGYQANHVIYSSPAIGNDGTIYFGCHDTFLYALYPNNGSVKWKYQTGNWIRVSPCIADDGTICVVSLDNYLYALNPDGSLKWKTYMGEAGTSPTIGQDGTIYAGYTTLHAINPLNGSVKWTYHMGGYMRGGTPCNSIDGTIYVGTHIDHYDGEIIALYPEGSLKFRKSIDAVESPPAIDSDGIVYIGSSDEDHIGYLHAFGRCELEADAHGPYIGIVNESIQFTGLAKGGYQPYEFCWNFGDNNISYHQNPTHVYNNAGNYTVTLTVTDDNDTTAIDITYALIRESNDPPNKPTITGETQGYIDESYEYTFTTTDPDDDDIWFYIEWGDDSNTGWIGPYNSGDVVTKSHTWDEEGVYTIRAKAKDIFDEESEWGTLEVTMPVNQQISYEHPFLSRFLKQLPNALPIIKNMI